MKPGLSMKQRVKIITVDPSQRRIEGALKDGGMIQIAVWEQTPFFRWPVEGEYWTVRKDNGIWMLGSYMQPPDAEHRLEDTPAGVAKINTDEVKTQSGKDMVITTNDTATSGKVLLWNGSGWTPSQVDSAGIANNAVGSPQIADGAVGSSKLANGSVGVNHLASIPHARFSITGATSHSGAFANPSGWVQEYQNGGSTFTIDTSVIRTGLTGNYSVGALLTITQNVNGVRALTITHINPVFNTTATSQWANGTASSIFNLEMTASTEKRTSATEGFNITIFQNSGVDLGYNIVFWISWRSN